MRFPAAGNVDGRAHHRAQRFAHSTSTSRAISSLVCKASVIAENNARAVRRHQLQVFQALHIQAAPRCPSSPVCVQRSPARAAWLSSCALSRTGELLANHDRRTRLSLSIQSPDWWSAARQRCPDKLAARAFEHDARRVQRHNIRPYALTTPMPMRSLILQRQRAAVVELMADILDVPVLFQPLSSARRRSAKAGCRPIAHAAVRDNLLLEQMLRLPTTSTLRTLNTWLLASTISAASTAMHQQPPSP